MAKTLLKLKQLEKVAVTRALVSDSSGDVSASTTTAAEILLLNTASAGTAVNGKAVIYSADGDIAVGDDLLFAAGAVQNFDSGDVTITHAAGKLTYGGDGTVEIDFANHEMTNVDINSGAIDGTAIGAASQAAGDFSAIGGVAAGTGAFTTLSASTSITLDSVAFSTSTLSSEVFASSDTAIPTAAAVKKYVDALSAGLRWLKPVEIATTAAIGSSEYDAASNSFRASSNAQWTAPIDGENVIFNSNEEQATRVLIKNNSGQKGSLVMTLSSAFSAGGELDVNFNDLHYRITFGSGTASPFNTATGADDGNRITAQIDTDNKNTIALQTEEIALNFSSYGHSAVRSQASVANDRITLTAPEGKKQSVTNAVESSTGSVMASGSAVAGTSGFNGIYYAHAQGSGSAKWEFRRASDALDLNNLSAAAVFVQKGLVNADQGYNLNSDYNSSPQAGLGDIDLMDQSWVQFTGTGQITADTGLEKDGNVIRMDIENGLSSITPAVGDFVALGDESAASGTMGQGTVGGMLDLIAGDVNVNASGVSTHAADSVGQAEIDVAEFTVNITSAAGETSANIGVANADASAVQDMMDSPLTQVYFNGLRLSKAASEANAKGSDAAHGDYFLKRVDNSNIQICFDAADYADNEKFQLIILKS